MLLLTGAATGCSVVLSGLSWPGLMSVAGERGLGQGCWSWSIAGADHMSEQEQAGHTEAGLQCNLWLQPHSSPGSGGSVKSLM